SRIISTPYRECMGWVARGAMRIGSESEIYGQAGPSYHRLCAPPSRIIRYPQTNNIPSSVPLKHAMGPFCFHELQLNDARTGAIDAGDAAARHGFQCNQRQR